MIYLDNQSTTRCDPRVVEAMLPYFTEHYGNAASATHAFGWTAKAAVDLAREQVAALIGANTNELVFCSGATEANNLAIRGAAEAYAERSKELVVAATEHASVIDCVRQLERQGWTLRIVPVDSMGLIQPDALLKALTPNTTLVSIMLVNNEIGVIQDVAALAELVHKVDPKIIFHCDAAQAPGKLEVDVKALGADLVTLSAHKVYGPKGVGALWRRRRPRLALRPLIEGGGQEEGLRSGTLAVPLIVGFGLACELASAELMSDSRRISRLATRLLDGLRGELDGVSINGSMVSRVPGNLNLAFAGVKADRLLSELGGIAISTGSACSSAEGKPSHVLAALMDKERAQQSVRFGIGRFTCEQEIDDCIEQVSAAVHGLRNAS